MNRLWKTNDKQSDEMTILKKGEEQKLKSMNKTRRHCLNEVKDPVSTLSGGIRKNYRNYRKHVTGTYSFSEYMRQSSMFTLVSGLPTVLGTILRARVYRRVLGSVGSSCLIEKNVRFCVPQKIFLGDRVFIGENTYFDVNNLDSEIRLGDDVHIGQNSIICICEREEEPAIDKIHMHKNTAINAYSFLFSCGGIDIGKYSMLGFDVALLGAHLNGAETGRIEIGEDVWLGAHVTVLPEVTIGEGSVIGAGAVVMDDIPPYSMATGFPAKVMRKRK